MVKYCPRCNNAVTDPDRFCPMCGYGFTGQGVPGNMGQPQNYGGDRVGAYRMKNEGVSAILSFLVMGLGQIYNGQILKGLVMFFTMTIIGIVTYIFVMTLDTETVLVLGIVLAGLGLFVWIYGITDAYLKAKTYNETLMMTGQPPW
jgi:TM2 domain-containing membrane protein YozV